MQTFGKTMQTARSGFALWNSKKQLFFKEYHSCNKPVWTKILPEIGCFSRNVAVRLAKRLACQSQIVRIVSLDLIDSLVNEEKRKSNLGLALDGQKN